jgi:hypothetical protein
MGAAPEINSKVDANRARVDMPELVWRLLLTDTLILQTHRLLELTSLLAAFGTPGLLLLLESGKLRLTCEAFSLGFKLPHDATDESEFQFLTVWEANRDEYVAKALGGVGHLTFPGIAKATDVIARYIEQPPDENSASLKILSALRSRLHEGDPLVRQGIALVAQQTNLEIAPAELFVHAEPRGPSTYRITSNLAAISSMPAPWCRNTLGRGVLGVARIYERLHQMQRHEALSASKSTDLPLLGTYLDVLEHSLNPNAAIVQAHRVVELTATPVVSNSTKIDAKKLIEASRSTECLEFRKWLMDVHTLSDVEVVQRLGSLSTRFGVAATSNVGRGLRWLACTLVGLPPDIGPVAGAIAGALDTFVIERIIRPGGPAVFLNRLYPSILGSSQPR